MIPTRLHSRYAWRVCTNIDATLFHKIESKLFLATRHSLLKDSPGIGNLNCYLSGNAFVNKQFSNQKRNGKFDCPNSLSISGEHGRSWACQGPQSDAYVCVCVHSNGDHQQHLCSINSQLNIRNGFGNALGSIDQQKLRTSAALVLAPAPAMAKAARFSRSSRLVIL